MDIHICATYIVTIVNCEFWSKSFCYLSTWKNRIRCLSQIEDYRSKTKIVNKKYQARRAEGQEHRYILAPTRVLWTPGFVLFMILFSLYDKLYTPENITCPKTNFYLRLNKLEPNQNGSIVEMGESVNSQGHRNEKKWVGLGTANSEALGNIKQFFYDTDTSTLS